jgi:Tfp pilus assembly protein FimT
MRYGSQAGSTGHPNAGFVLVDLVVTIAIIGLLIALSMPYLKVQTTPTRMHLVLTNIASLLRNARTAAIVQNHSVTAVLDNDRHLIRSGDAIVYLPADVGVSPASGGRCVSDDRLTEIIFYGDGTNCGGVLRFSQGREFYRLRVNWVTGYVEIAKG